MLGHLVWIDAQERELNNRGDNSVHISTKNMLFFLVNVTYDCFVVDPEMQGFFFPFDALCGCQYVCYTAI